MPGGRVAPFKPGPIRPIAIGPIAIHGQQNLNQTFRKRAVGDADGAKHYGYWQFVYVKDMAMKRRGGSIRPDTAASVTEMPRFAIEGQRFLAPAIAPGLHVVATPIGNLGDISIRALATLAASDAIVCEDTRVTATLVRHYAIERPLIAYHEHNAALVRPKLMAMMAEGQRIALVSDAGTPLVSDPGFKLVREAREAGHAVTALPGASAVLAALVIAGLPTDRFFFEGFLPPKSGARLTRIAEIGRIPATLVLFESGPRLGDALADLAIGLGGMREAAVCREITKTFEEVRRAPLAELAAQYAETPPRGEIVIVIAPPAAETTSETDIDALIDAALKRGSVKDAADAVAAATGAPRRDIYRRALERAGREP